MPPDGRLRGRETRQWLDVDLYAIAFTDWLACACAGADERAAKAVRACGTDLLADVAFAGTAGHVLDFDDTFSDGVAHVSATCAPAALVLAANLGLSLQAALDAYAAGFEAMAAVAAASHPALYDAGWHPTAVCGPIGAAVAASRLLRLSRPQRDNAIAVALLRAGGTRGAFGSDGKAIQVGLAAAAGVQGALMARARRGRGSAGGPWAGWGSRECLAPPGPPTPTADRGRAIERNWIKLYPSCLGTHSPIELAACARERIDGEPVRVVVHPVARQAAYLDEVRDGLSAKFSIPYCVAHTLLHGPPGVRDFARVDPRGPRALAAGRRRRRPVAARVRRGADGGRHRDRPGPVPPRSAVATRRGRRPRRQVGRPGRDAPRRDSRRPRRAGRGGARCGRPGLVDGQPPAGSSDGSAAATRRVPSRSAANAPSSDSAADTAMAGANPSLKAAGDA